MGSRLFSYGDVKGRPSRAGFDLSKKFCFTAKAGELLPVYWKTLLPGTKVNLKDLHFTRTMPVNTAAYTRIKEYFDWYFVPLRLINKNLNPALVNMLDQSNIATSLIQNKVVSDEIPYFDYGTLTSCLKTFNTQHPSYLDIVGFERVPRTLKLLRYLRYGNFLFDDGLSSLTNKNMGYSSVNDFNLYAKWNLNVNILPLAAYQKIYCDHFRFEQWEKAQPYTYNFDYYSGGNILADYKSDPSDLLMKDNLFTLRYANYPRDLFMGILPSSQLGSVATVSVTNTGENLSNYLYLRNTSASGTPVILTSANSSNPIVLKQKTGSVTVDNSLGVRASALSSTFDILSFRIANAIQRMREIQQCAGQGYKEQLEARWNVKLSTALSDHCTYIGGNSSQINISEVLNNNLDADQAQADIKGKGVGSGSGSESFETQEHGILMCIYHSVPVLDYQLTGCDFQLLNTYATDLPQPELDNLGLEALPYFVFVNDAIATQPSNLTSSTILGYVPRYIAYKTDIDCVDGAFLTSLKSWVTPLTIDEIISKISLGSSSGPWSPNYGLFKVSPFVLNSIFVSQCDSTVDTDQFLVEAFFDVKAVQNLDYDGMPY